MEQIYVLNLSCLCKIKAVSPEEANKKFWDNAQLPSQNCIEGRYAIEKIYPEPPWTE